ncbi:T9SS type A sorting domain-containing protein [Chryseobacterium populi]|uniref:Por secretion system C-terminal sorting domain containing protein n=1 Tax=Chryseobacterium populi TaxID=1144316 RepID=J2T2A5_9FLAO|nr:T9SS type A sorting domain-containing protein [Chryseobacterium populi]EJL72107.1 Por secretion system C-terminal sorting domain containing protein [Chryseobacterium populi]
MKNLLFFLIFTLCFSIIHGQSPNIMWQKTLGGTDQDEIFDIEPTSDGGFIIAGYTGSANGDVTANHGLQDMWVIKTDVSGNIQWQKTLGGSALDRASGIRQTNDGGYIVIGYTNSTDGDITINHGMDDLWIVKLSPSGTLQWQKTYGGAYEEGGNNIYQTDDGGYIAIGFAISLNDGFRDMWILKLDDTGNIQWQKTFGNIYDDDGSQIRQTPDGNYIAIGTYSSLPGNTSDFWILKLGPSGNMIWQKMMGGSSRENPYDVQLTNDGGYIMTGYTQSSDGDVTGSHGQGEVWTVKLNSLGNIEWEKTFGGTSSDYGEAIKQTLDGGYIIAGIAQSANGDVTGNHGFHDFWVIKTDASGNIQWQQTLGGSSLDTARDIVQTSDDSYVVIGGTFSTDGNVTGNHGSLDGWIVKLKTEQLSTQENNINNIISLYPNPAKESFYLDNLPGEIIVHITDMSGRKLFTQKYNGKKVSINTNQFINGVYMIQVECQGKTILSDKLIIRK